MRQKVTSRRRKVTGHRNLSENRHRGNDRGYLCVPGVRAYSRPQLPGLGASLGVAAVFVGSDSAPVGLQVLGGVVGGSVGVVVCSPDGVVVGDSVEVVVVDEGDVVGGVGVHVGSVGVVGVVVGVDGGVLGGVYGGLVGDVDVVPGPLVGLAMVGFVELGRLLVGPGVVGATVGRVVAGAVVGAVVAVVGGGVVGGGVVAVRSSPSPLLPLSPGVVIVPGLSGTLTVSLL